MESMTPAVADWLERVEGAPQDVGARLRGDAGEGKCRRVVIARTGVEAAARLRAGASEWVVTEFVRSMRPEVAFLFPGSGAQRLNMGRELRHSESGFRAEFDRLSDVLADREGFDLRECLFVDGAEAHGKAADRLTETAVLMPAMLAFSVRPCPVPNRCCW